jgi:hypothetical protein
MAGPWLKGSGKDDLEFSLHWTVPWIS